jgi:hypothetical protein
MEAGGAIGAFATMIAGAVELAVLGAIFALIGGRPRESILGAVGGLLVGLTAGVMGGQDSVVLVATFGLVFGAITGATLRPYLRLLSLPFILLGRLLDRGQRLSALALRPDGRVEHQAFVPALHRHAPESHVEGMRSPLPCGPKAFHGRKGYAQAIDSTSEGSVPHRNDSRNHACPALR